MSVNTGVRILFALTTVMLFAATAGIYSARSQQERAGDYGGQPGYGETVSATPAPDVDTLTPETLDDLIRMYEKNVT